MRSSTLEGSLTVSDAACWFTPSYTSHGHPARFGLRGDAHPLGPAPATSYAI